MESFLLTDWVTIRGTAFASIPQNATGWLDLPAHEDAQFHIDVKSASGGANMSYETSPTRQETTFVSMVSFAMNVGIRVDRAFFNTSLVPLTRFLRWRVSFNALGGAATFRVWVSAYSYE